MGTDVDLMRFSETHLTPFIELLILTDKIEKGMFVKPNNEE